MAAPAAGKRKRDFSEDDAYLIDPKYTPTTILTALQEVAQHTGRRRIDWKALVAKTATGIKSAREYQMLWRYLAYSHDFIQNVDDSAQPLSDESDLECEIEPFPTPSSEAAAEASRCTKILIYGSSREQASSHGVNSEVPLLNSPNGKIMRLPFDKQLCQSHPRTNGTGPVSNSNQASRTVLSPDLFDGNGPEKKKGKPKPWSKEEDADLTTGVHKCGEGNWLDILHKYSFDNTRSAAELSQRWALIRKRQGTTKPAQAKKVCAKIDITATQNAVYMAVGKTGLSTLRKSVFGTAIPELNFAAASSSFPVPVAVPLQVQMPLRQVQQAPVQTGLSTSNKSGINPKKQVAHTNTTNGPSSIQAAAIAAGGRIATQSAATKLMKAAQSTKAVRVRSRGTGSLKTSSSSKSSTMASEYGARLGSGQHPEHPKCSAPTSSPLVLTTQSTGQVNAVPEVTGVNPLEQSASARLLETERRMSTTPVSGPCDNTVMDDEVTMEDLFPEDVQESDIVDPKADQEIIDTKDADILDQFDRFVESQQKQPKELPAVGKSTPVSARAPAALKKAKTLGSTCPPAVTPSGLVGTGNAGVMSKALGGLPSGPGTTGKQNRCQEIMAQTQHAKNSKSNVIAKNAAPGTRTPARNAPPSIGAPSGNAAPGAGTPPRNAASGAGAPARNVAPGTGPRANRQYNPVVTGARKGNPPPAIK